MIIRVRVEGSEWGIGSTDEMWELYLGDREAGQQAQMESPVNSG